MAPKAAKDAAKKKAAKQRKILAVLALPLLGALFFAYTTMSHLNSSSAPHASGTAVSATPSAATTPAASTAVGPTGIDASAVVTPGIVAAPVGSLRAFTGLGRKDPFNDDGPSLTKQSSTPTSGSGSPAPTTSAPTKNPTIADNKPTSKTTSHPLPRAVISVNGKSTNVARGAKFGHAPGSSDPLFRLVRVSTTRAVIAVVGTRLQYTLNLQLPLTLTRKGDGAKYILMLVRTKTGH